jgi:hypothetical protein
VAVELGSILLEHLTHVSVRERERIVHHDVPGFDGELAQTLGRLSVEVSLRGLFYGDNAVEELDRLRSAQLQHEPVDFFMEAVGEGYFTQVLISRLEVHQRSGYLNQFDFLCDVVEYVEPPEPVTEYPLAALDTGLLNDAASFVDDVQNGLEEVSQLTDLLTNIPNFADPTTGLQGIETDFVTLANDGAALLSGIRTIFLGTPE